MALDDRKSAILRAVVMEYVETAQPVGSNTISKRSDVSVSPATVRSELANLETEGYLEQPHTSAGRVPTEKGYRFYVDDMSPELAMSPAGVARVSEFFAAAHGELEQMLRETSRLLSSLTGTAAVVTEQGGEAATVRSVQLVDLAPTMLLVVAVTSAGAVVKRTFEIPAPGVDAGGLADAQKALADELVGGPLAEVAGHAFDSSLPGAELAILAAAAIGEAAEAEGAHVYVDGASRIANVFDTRETVEGVLTVLEKQFVVIGLLQEIVDGGLTVAIGSETGVEPLAECSLVVAPYESDTGPAGAIAVLGPTRMDYAETVSAVSQVSRRLSRLLSEG
ncbi:MAG: heat-inducible transcription repressor HrcA [Actinomycetia bacterium]|nr:heat-inducible transcription repressor HrcA [Actinomycetes bacterium]